MESSPPHKNSFMSHRIADEHRLRNIARTKYPREKMVALLKQGLTPIEVGEKLGCAPALVRRKCPGLYKATVKCEDHIDYIRKEFFKGTSFKDMAKEIGIGASTINKFCRTMHWERPSSGRLKRLLAHNIG